MANEYKGGKRLAGNRPVNRNTPAPAPQQDAAAYTPPVNAEPAANESVVDDILRSISEQSTTPVPNVRRSSPPVEQPAAPKQPAPAPSPVEDATTAYRPVRENEYEAAARHAAQQTRMGNTNPIPPVDPYNMRDPAMTQSFRPARPTHRDTDRLPTIVDEQPVRRNTGLSKLLTFLVAILVVIALVLGARMIYILGPTLGWNLPDLSQVPVVSNILGLIPSAEEPEPVAPVEQDTPTVTVQDPTSVTLDAEELELHPGDSVVLTATLDVEGWDGLLAWASSDKTEEIARLTVLGPTTAQVDYVGNGMCSIVVMVGIKPADGSEAPSASCYINCVSDEEPEQPTDPVTPDESNEPDAPHVDVVLNRDDFTLNVGESHKLMDQNADQFTWTSADPAIATVNANGVVTAVKRGTTTITATASDGTTASAIARVR